MIIIFFKKKIGLFLLGISLTFAGVFLISQGRKTLREASGTLTSSEDIEVLISFSYVLVSKFCFKK